MGVLAIFITDTVVHHHLWVVKELTFMLSTVFEMAFLFPAIAWTDIVQVCSCPLNDMCCSASSPRPQHYRHLKCLIQADCVKHTDRFVLLVITASIKPFVALHLSQLCPLYHQ